MREHFTEYYSPSRDDYKALWENATIVFDTNVLLDLYRLPAAARDQFLDLLELLKDRLWLPHHVALEFQRRRLTVISGERLSTEKTLEKAQNLHDTVLEAVTNLEIEKRGLGIETKPLIEAFSASKDALMAAIEKTHDSLADISTPDAIRERIDQIIGENIGPPPSNQSELDELTKDGDHRYENDIPPGYKDAIKDKDPTNANFRYDGLTYASKFGDLILWRQILSAFSVQKDASVLFVTSDQKEDWWWKEKGKTVGPRPELIREISNLAGVKHFWMYSSDQFLKHARDYTKATISEESVNEMQEVMRLAEDRSNANFVKFKVPTARFFGGGPALKSEFHKNRPDYGMIERQVAHRLGHDIEKIEFSNGFPDFIVKTEGLKIGYEVKFLRNFRDFKLPPLAVNAMTRGYLETHEGRLDKFFLALVAREEDLTKFLSENGNDGLRERSFSLLGRYPIGGIYFFSYDEQADFVELYDIINL